MKHARQKIREGVVTQLSASITDAAISRSKQGKVMTFPHIDVYIATEVSEMENNTIGAPRRYSRMATLIVSAAVQVSDNVDDAADDLAAQIETAMATDLTFSGLAVDSELFATNIETETKADALYARAELSYRVWYRTDASNPETIL